MAATFINVSLEDFEKVFNIPNKFDSSKRAFELVKPNGEEAYYYCVIRENDAGKLICKVYTSIKYDSIDCREVGRDAIRVCLVWEDREGWSAGLAKARIYRSGGEGKTANDVIVRVMEKAREIARSKKCPNCNRAMAIRQGKDSKFWGCCGFAKKLCSKTCSL